MDEFHKKRSMIGPFLEKQQPLKIQNKINKLTHYDCKLIEDFNDDVPDESEVFVKNHLLKINKNKIINE